MSRIAYVNGRYLPRQQATISVEDRGLQLADSVYEVCEIAGGALIDLDRHLDRLSRSLAELRIAEPMSRAALVFVLKETARRNGVRDGNIYLQVTRGTARRDFPFPDGDVRPNVIVLARAADPRRNAALAENGIAIISVPEIRWGRVDIKSTGLLASVLAKQAAKEAGAREAWYVDADGFVTEGGSSNAWIITADGRVVTRSADSGILRGITRTTLIDLLKTEGLQLEERPFTIPEAKAAREAFATAATIVVMPIVSIDGTPVGNGHPGSIATMLRARFHEAAQRSLI